MRFEQAALTVTSALRAIDLQYALIGGFAVSIWTDPRFTQDIDLVVVVDGDDAAESAARRLSDSGYTILTLIEHEARNRLATIRLGLSGSSWVVDLLFASSGIESEIVLAAEPIEVVSGLRLPVARIGHLIALKLLARDDEMCPQDAADLRALVDEADSAEFDLARNAVALIEARGYARGRDLETALRRLIDGRDQLRPVAPIVR